MTATDYAAYQAAVLSFFEREGVTNLSAHAMEPYFSWRPCVCCGTTEGGDRYDANGYNPTTQEVKEYEFACTDCVYYAESGRLDDQTMEQIKRSSRPETMTLADHAEAWWREQGNTVPLRNTAAWTAMYEQWHAFAFADFGNATERK